MIMPILLVLIFASITIQVAVTDREKHDLANKDDVVKIIFCVGYALFYFLDWFFV